MIISCCIIVVVKHTLPIGYWEGHDLVKLLEHPDALGVSWCMRLASMWFRVVSHRFTVFEGLLKAFIHFIDFRVPRFKAKKT